MYFFVSSIINGQIIHSVNRVHIMVNIRKDNHHEISVCQTRGIFCHGCAAPNNTMAMYQVVVGEKEQTLSLILPQLPMVVSVSRRCGNRENHRNIHTM